MTVAAVNDNGVRHAADCPYGPLGVVLIHVPEHAPYPYRRLTRLPGVIIVDGFATPQQAVAGRVARTLPISRGVDT